VEALFRFRGVERLLIEAGAIVCVVLGTWLYRAGVAGATQVAAEGLGFKFKMANAAPGTVLAFFGMAIMIVGLMKPLEVTSGGEAKSPASNETKKAPPPVNPSVTYGDGVSALVELLGRIQQRPSPPDAQSARVALRDLAEESKTKGCSPILVETAQFCSTLAEAGGGSSAALNANASETFMAIQKNAKALNARLSVSPQP
jgi:hypothetical protein